MKNNKRLVLFLIFSAFSTMVCRCTFDRGEATTLILSDGATLDRREFYESNPTWKTIFYFYTYDCSIPCPDGSQVTAKEMSLPNIEGKYNGVDIVDLDLATLQNQYCMAATPTPTATPLAQDPSAGVPVSIPLLTERVTACNYKEGFVNFELADPAREYDSMQVQLYLNNTQTKCDVPSTNNGVLSCTLPASIRFPVNIQAQVNNVEVNNFNFDGSYCGYKDPSTSGDSDSDNDNPSGDSGAPDVVPTATDFGG